jgi:hypothetical protein
VIDEFVTWPASAGNVSRCLERAVAITAAKVKGAVGAKSWRGTSSAFDFPSMAPQSNGLAQPAGTIVAPVYALR